MGSKPSIELFNNSLKTDVPLPEQLYEKKEEETKPVEVTTSTSVTSSVQSQPTAQSAHSAQPAVQHSVPQAVPTTQVYPPQTQVHHPYTQMGYANPATQYHPGYDPRAYSSPYPVAPPVQTHPMPNNVHGGVIMQAASVPPPSEDDEFSDFTQAEPQQPQQHHVDVAIIQSHSSAMESISKLHLSAQVESTITPSAPAEMDLLSLTTDESVVGSSQQNSMATLGNSLLFPVDSNTSLTQSYHQEPALLFSNTVHHASNNSMHLSDEVVLKKDKDDNEDDDYEFVFQTAQDNMKQMIDLSDDLDSIPPAALATPANITLESKEAKLPTSGSDIALQLASSTVATSATSLPSADSTDGLTHSQKSSSGLVFQSHLNPNEDRLAVFDDLVEQDLQGMNEDWDDFAKATHSDDSLPNATTEPAPAALDLLDMTPPLQSSSLSSSFVDISYPTSGGNEDEFNDDDFGDFEGSNKHVETASNVAVDNKPHIGIAEQDLEDDFGAFNSPTLPSAHESVQAQSAIEMETGGEKEELLDFSSPPPIGQDPLSVLDDQPVLDLLDMGPPLSASSISISQAAVPHAQQLSVADENNWEDDGFGEFEGPIDQEKHDRPLVDSSLTSASAPIISEKTNNYGAGLIQQSFNDEFGDFESHSNKVGISASKQENAVGDVEEDFGNFESHAIPSQPSAAAHVEPFANIVTPMKAPAAFVDNLLEFSPMDYPTKKVEASAASTLPSFPSSDSLPSPLKDDSQPSRGTQSLPASKVAAAKVEDLFASQLPIASSHLSTAGPPSSWAAFDSTNDDLFPTPSAAPAVKEPVKNRVESPRALKPLGLPELETLLTTLAKRRLYNHAYACAKQISILKRLKHLTNEKTSAMEKDDLETAQELKKAAAVLASELRPMSQELLWREAAAESAKYTGQSLEDMLESISIFDENLGRLFSSRFIALKSKNASLEEQMRHCLLAKRSARVILAICSSHRDHPKIWQRLSEALSSKLISYKQVHASFDKLVAADQKAVLESNEMQQYLQAIKQIAECSLWVSATMQEGFIQEEESRTLWKHAQQVLRQLSSFWKIERSEFDHISREEFTAECEIASDRSDAVITFCNLVLRPLSACSKGKEGAVEEYYPHHCVLGGMTFLKIVSYVRLVVLARRRLSQVYTVTALSSFVFDCNE
eukprot:scaffold2028_cov181-Ochromonas_danica.AAC.30